MSEKNPARRTHLVAVVALVILFALPTALHAQGTDPQSVIESWAAALNTGDIDATLAFLADAAAVSIVPPPPGTGGVYSGKEEVRGWYEGLVAGNGVTTLSDCDVDGETVTCTDTYVDDGLKGMGVDFIVGELVAVVRDGKIQSYTVTMSPESLAKLSPPPEDLPATGGNAPAGALPLWPGVAGLLILALGVGLQRMPSRLR